MSARRVDDSSFLAPVTVHAQTTRLELPSGAVHIHKTGIEFQAREPIADWTEMTVMLEAPLGARKVQCTGVVVECRGNRHQGYCIKMHFTSLSRQAQARLHELAILS